MGTCVEKIPNALRGQHEACIQVPPIQDVPLLNLDVGKLAEQPLLLNRARDLHQHNAGKLAPLPDLVPQIHCAVDAVPELSCVLVELGCL
jgi:hypothetical protein